MKPIKLRFINIEIMAENLPGETSWKRAQKKAESLGEGWRLPTVNELLFLSTLYDIGNICNLNFPKNKYDNGNWYDPNDKYWSIDDSEHVNKSELGTDGSSKYARYVDLKDKISNTFKKSLELRVRLVRDI
jgi:hypothetical protein